MSFCSQSPASMFQSLAVFSAPISTAVEFSAVSCPGNFTPIGAEMLINYFVCCARSMASSKDSSGHGASTKSAFAY